MHHTAANLGHLTSPEYNCANQFSKCGRTYTARMGTLHLGGTVTVPKTRVLKDPVAMQHASHQYSTQPTHSPTHGSRSRRCVNLTCDHVATVRRGYRGQRQLRGNTSTAPWEHIHSTVGTHPQHIHHAMHPPHYVSTTLCTARRYHSLRPRL